jgi:hypothetical protein
VPQRLHLAPRGLRAVTVEEAPRGADEFLAGRGDERGGGLPVSRPRRASSRRWLETPFTVAQPLTGTGNQSVNVAPFPGAVSSVTEPPCRCMQA